MHVRLVVYLEWHDGKSMRTERWVRFEPDLPQPEVGVLYRLPLAIPAADAPDGGDFDRIVVSQEVIYDVEHGAFEVVLEPPDCADNTTVETERWYLRAMGFQQREEGP